MPQNPWCQNLSLRDNILFGAPMDEERYKAVLHACALELDLQILAQGDQSKVGTGAGKHGWGGSCTGMRLLQACMQGL